jgi:hypothetical protein
MTETLIIAAIFACLLLGTFLVSKIIVAKQNVALLERSSAFKDTFSVPEGPTDVASQVSDNTGTVYETKKSKSKSTGLPIKLPPFLGTVINFFTSTKESRVKAQFDFERDLLQTLKPEDEGADFSQSLFMNDETNDHSSALKWTLYGIAFGMSGFPKNTKMESIGENLFDKSSQIREEQNFSLK